MDTEFLLFYDNIFLIIVIFALLYAVHDKTIGCLFFLLVQLSNFASYLNASPNNQSFANFVLKFTNILNAASYNITIFEELGCFHAHGYASGGAGGDYGSCF